MSIKNNCIVDRIEGEYVVIEYGDEIFHIPKILFQTDVNEGDVIEISITVDHEKTKKRRNDIENLSKKLFNNKK